MMNKKKLIILTGPTAVGKTSLSIGLAKSVGGEIISADSMQVYRHMDIGSAKIKKEEMQKIPHYLVDILSPREEFNVYLFQKLAKDAMERIYTNGHIPILVGGTGFYIQSVLYDIDFTKNDDDTAYREELERLLEEKGAAYLHERLTEVDEESAKAIHENNAKRVIRALEYFHLTGTPISEHNRQEREKESPYDFRYFVLNDDRKLLYRRIEQRVDKMIEAGLVEERDTRHFAKRQLTWFRRERNVIFVNKPDFGYDEDKILAYMNERIQQENGNDKSVI